MPGSAMIRPNARTRGRARLAGALALLLALASGLAGPIRAQVAPELDLRCAYLFNFARFTTWPDEAFASPSAPFTFAVAGDHELAVRLQHLLAGRRLDRHPLVVIEPTGAAECAGAQVVYVGPERRKEAGDVLAACQGRPVLTVSESPSFLRQGGMVLIVQVEENLRFDINQAAAAASRLRISSRLLELAREVGGSGS